LLTDLKQTRIQDQWKVLKI